MAHFSKLTTDVVTYRYCTEASNQKSKYAYWKIFFYKKSTDDDNVVVSVLFCESVQLFIVMSLRAWFVT